jgi:hypothetical protein
VVSIPFPRQYAPGGDHPEIEEREEAFLGELRAVSSHFLDESLGVRAANECLDGLAERVVGTRAEVVDREDNR